jgi:tetratricopeptide (TPR) repeat protein
VLHGLVLAGGVSAVAATGPGTLPYHNEQEWIVSSVCRNAFELLSYVKDKKGEIVNPTQVAVEEFPGDPRSYDVTVQSAHATVKASVRLTGSIWSADAYLPFCQAAAQNLKISPSGSSAGQGSPLHALLDFSEATIESENERVSHWLTAQPGNAAAHEQAALILGTLAMKENSGYFWDPRDACNHACAHLAVAEFLHAGASLAVEGRMAGCLVGLIADTKTATGQQLDQLAHEASKSIDLTNWLNAARMRNTRDWRIVKTPETASPLEQVEYFRALAEAVDPDQAIAWLQAHSIPDRPDWARIVLELDFSVEAGHAFAQSSVGAEIKLMETALPGIFGGPDLLMNLNRAPGDVLSADGASAGTLVVINRGMWAHFFQRHLFHALAETGDFFANKWGVPDNTRELDQSADKAFSSLTFFPYYKIANQQIRKSPADPNDALELFQAHPEWAPYFLTAMASPTPPDTTRFPMVAVDWFRPRLLTGTAYAASARLSGMAVDGREIDQLEAVAPSEFFAAQLALTMRYHNHYTFEQAQKILGPLLDYYVPAISLAGNAAGLTFDQKAQLAGKSAAINPDGYFDLAQLYLDNHQEDKAAAAYQHWYDNALDRVEVSNGVAWLVNYYYDHGQQDRALSIAKDAAEVYSSTGLTTMMNLQEKMGHLDEAEDYGQKILERYDDSGPLTLFYKRHADGGNANFQAKLDALTKTAFPQGLCKVALADFSAPPSVGMQFTQTSSSMQQNGLTADQVVVALDGYGVQNKAQYAFIRGLSDSAVMQFIVWDGRTYRAITANQPGRHFGIDMQDYHH